MSRTPLSFNDIGDISVNRKMKSRGTGEPSIAASGGTAHSLAVGGAFRGEGDGWVVEWSGEGDVEGFCGW
jgi:hypothetical protein